jgi:diguanylate cyclase (GGDEF)-like protein
MSKETKLLQGLHAALMPDYNRAAAAYWWSLILLGSAALGVAIAEAATRPFPAQLQILAICVASMAAGAFPVPLRGTKSSFSAAEIFIFLALLYVGLDAACLAAAAEAFVASARTSKRWTSRLVSPAVAVVSIGLTGWLYLEAAFALQLRQLDGEAVLLVLLPATAVAYFVLTSFLIRMVLHLKAGKPLPLGALLGSFGWIGTTYAANAFIAALLYLTARHAGAVVLLAAGPVIALLLTTLHFHFRQREAEEAQARTRVEAAEREAAQAARHNEELRRIAGDGRTSLVDRRRFLECLAKAFEREGSIERRLAVIYVDVDHFKRINDTLGHAAGEEFLVHVANRIQRRVRRPDLVGSLDGDEFAVLAKDVDDSQAVELARRLLQALAMPYAVGGVTVESSASIGIACSGGGYQVPDEMLRDAIAAVQQAKSLGRARCVVHHRDVLQRAAVTESNALLDA